MIGLPDSPILVAAYCCGFCGERTELAFRHVCVTGRSRPPAPYDFADPYGTVPVEHAEYLNTSRGGLILPSKGVVVLTRRPVAH